MANSYLHAKSSARKFGGVPEDYQAIHDFFDQTKSAWADQRHRAILHNAFGIFLCERVFGKFIVNSEGAEVPVRIIGEQHVIEDHGFIPTIENWLDELPRKSWMFRNAVPLSKTLENFTKTVEAEGALPLADPPVVVPMAEPPPAPPPLAPPAPTNVPTYVPFLGPVSRAEMVIDERPNR